jgi:hypothetical protein
MVAAAALFFYPNMELIDVRESNTATHIGWAKDIAETGHLYPGHFLYHVLTVFVHAVSDVTYQLTWEQANIIVMIGAKALSALILWVLIRRALSNRDGVLGSTIAVVLPIALLFASAISLLTWEKGNYYLGYIPPNLYVSQTLVVIQTVALALFFVLLKVLDPERRVSLVRDVPLLACLAAVSVVAKPSYAMVMLPALGLILLTRMLKRRGAGRFKPNLMIGLSVGVPVLLVMLWIYTSTYLPVQETYGAKSGAAAYANGGDGGSGVLFRPLEVMKYFQDRTFAYEAREAGGAASHAAISLTPQGVEAYIAGRPGSTHVYMWLVIKLLLSLLFPLVVTIAYWSKARRDLRFQFAWLQMGVGLMFTYLAAESGSYSGNFTWSGQIACFLLFVVSALFLLEQRGSPESLPRSPRSTAIVLVCWGVLVLHVVSGVGPYLHPTVT